MELNVRKEGESGPKILILHGLMGSSRNWQRIIRKLSKDFRVIAPDLRNHGESPHGPHSIALMKQDITELIEKSFHEPPHIIGHSMGGQAAMLVATSNEVGVGSLTLADSSPLRLTGNLWKLLSALEGLDTGSLLSRADAEEALSHNIPDIRIRQFLLQNLKRTERGEFVWQCNLRELIRYAKEESFSIPEGAVYEGPTLVLAGETSEYRVWEHKQVFETHFPNLEFEIIDGAGHWLHADVPELFTEKIRGFIDSNT